MGEQAVEESVQGAFARGCSRQKCNALLHGANNVFIAEFGELAVALWVVEHGHRAEWSRLYGRCGCKRLADGSCLRLGKVVILPPFGMNLCPLLFTEEVVLGCSSIVFSSSDLMLRVVALRLDPVVELLLH